MILEIQDMHLEDDFIHVFSYSCNLENCLVLLQLFAHVPGIVVSKINKKFLINECNKWRAQWATQWLSLLIVTDLHAYMSPYLYEADDGFLGKEKAFLSSWLFIAP